MRHDPQTNQPHGDIHKKPPPARAVVPDPNTIKTLDSEDESVESDDGVLAQGPLRRLNPRKSTQGGISMRPSKKRASPNPEKGEYRDQHGNRRTTATRSARSSAGSRASRARRAAAAATAVRRSRATTIRIS